MSCVSICLHGCQSYHAAPLAPQDSVNEFDSRHLDDQSVATDLARLLPGYAVRQPPEEWDRGQLLAVALVRNSSLVVADAELAAALARERTAAEPLNPDLTLQSEYARREVHPWLYGIALEWPLQSKSRRQLSREIANLDAISMRLNLMNETWAVRRDLVAGLTDWEGSRRRLDLLDQLSAMQDRLLLIARQRVDAGEDSPTVLPAFEQASIDTEHQRLEARSTVDAAKAATATAMGMPLQIMDSLRFSWPDWGAPPAIPDTMERQVRETALLSRTDLSRAIDNYAISEKRLELAIARQYPQLIVAPGYYWDHGIAKFPFNLSFSLPKNGNKAEIAEARIERDLAGKRMLALQADIHGQIAAAKREEALMQTAQAVAVRESKLAQQLVSQSDLGARAGAVGVEEQVAAKITGMRAQLEVLQTQARLQTARNRLEDVVRTPLSGPELSMNLSATARTSGAAR